MPCSIVSKHLLIFFKDDDNLQAQTAIAAGSNSLLPLAVQKLIRMIFDIESMKKALLEFEVTAMIGLDTCKSHSSKMATYREVHLEFGTISVLSSEECQNIMYCFKLYFALSLT